jgi:hypothetical protein
VRDKVVSLILATDFGVHKQILDAANEMADKHASGEHGSDDMPGDAMLGLKMAIKLADLSYLSKGDRYVQVWTDRVLDEFFAQGDAEKALIADGAPSPRLHPAPQPPPALEHPGASSARTSRAARQRAC